MGMPPFPLTHVLEMRIAPKPALPVSPGEAFATIDAEATAGMAQIDAEFAAQSASSESTTVVSTTTSEGTVIQATTTSAAGTATEALPVAEFRNTIEKPPQVVYALPLPPEYVEVNPIPAELLTLTQDGAVIESSGHRLSLIEIRSQAGLRSHLGTDAKGSPLLAPGTKLFNELRAFVEAYWEQNKKTPMELVWRDFAQGLHLLCIIEDWRWIYDKDNRLQPRYSLRLKAYGTTASAPRSFLDEFLGPIIKGAQDIGATIDKAAMWVEIARANFQDALNIGEQLKEPLRALERVIEAVGGIAGDIRAAKFFAKDTVNDVLDLIDAAAFAISDIADALGIDRDEQTWFPAVHNALGQAHDAVTTAFLQAVVTGQAGYTAGKQGKASTYVVKAGDTLQSIAQQLYGDPAQWKTLADANELAAPYISPSGLPGTVGPGDTIVIPQAIGIQASDVLPPATPPAVDMASSDELLFGRDIYRSPETLEWVASANNDDVRIASGIEAVEQAVQSRLQTVKGENLAFPEIGLPALVGQPNTKSATAYLLALVDEQLRADDRVVAVEQPQGVDAGASLQLEFGVVLLGDKTLPGPLNASALLGSL